MKKCLISLFCTVIVLFTVDRIAIAESFTASVPNTAKSKGYLAPIKSGGSVEFQVNVTCNVADTFKVSIDKYASFFGYASWFTIEENSFTIAKGKPATFRVTVNSPVGTPDVTQSFNLFFKTVDRSNNDQSFYGGGTLTLIIDNTPPEILAIRTLSKTSTTVSFEWDCIDSRSLEYTQATYAAGSAVGVRGIKSYGIALRNQNGATVGSWSADATFSNNLHTFTAQPNTTYTPVVSAVDLAGNSSSKAGAAVTTPPAAPTNLAATGTDFCSTTLTWNASAGATRYHVYNAMQSPATEIYATAGTSYTVTGLKAGATYKYYVTAESAAGFSPNSSVLSVTMPSFPVCTIAGSFIICSSEASYTVSNLPAGYTVSWSGSSNLTLSSVSGNSATFVANGSGDGTITAAISLNGCGFSVEKKVQVGQPIPVIQGPLLLDPIGVEPCVGMNFTFSVAQRYPYESECQWTLYGEGGALVSDSRSAAFVCRALGMHTIAVKQFIYGCGWSELVEDDFSVPACEIWTPPFICPNPASSTVQLCMEEGAMLASPMRAPGKNDQEYEVRIYNMQNQLVKQESGICRGSSIPVDDLPEGFYVVHSIKNGVVQKQKLQIKR